MKNIKIKFSVLFLIIILFGVYTRAYATLNITVDVDVPSSCNATDTEGVVHNYSQSNSYLAICAIETAIDNGFISNVQLSNQFPSLGLFITAINDVVALPDNQYWAIYQNDSFANFGITLLPVITGDTIMFQLHDFSDNNLGDQIILNIRSLVNNEIKNNTGSGGSISVPVFNVSKAIQYLTNLQEIDGSFGGSDLYTDWTAIAFGALDGDDSLQLNNSKEKILTYFNSHNKLSSILTDNERRVMALLALGQNPYSFNGVNYIDAITSSFDGTQFGDVNLINDDIFALISLSKVGYTVDDDIFIKDIIFIISKQKSNGSFEESVDMTAATIQALKPLEKNNGVFETIIKANNYLVSEQKNNGSWNNSVFSTSWATQAMNILGGYWIKSNFTPVDYFAIQQVSDGAVLPISETIENRIWATSYAIPAVLDRSWGAIMHHVSKPVVVPSPVILPVIENKNVIEIKTVPAPISIQKQKSAKKILIEKSLAEHTIPVLNPIVLSAAAGKSGVLASGLVVIGGVVIGLLAYLGRYIFTKR